MHQLGDALENISDSVSYLELELDVFLAPDDNDILYLPELPVT